MNQIKRLIDILNKTDIFPNSEELADTLWLALQMGKVTTQEKTLINEKKIKPNKEEKIENDPPLENKKSPEIPENNPPPQSISTESKEQPKKSSLYPHKQNSGGINSGLKGQAFRTPALPNLHHALAFNRALRPLRKKIESRFRDELDIEQTVQNIAETNLFLPVLKGKSEHWLELVIVIDNAISMQIWKPLLDGFCRLLELQGTFKKIYFYQLDTENKEVKIRNKNNRLIKDKEITKLHQPRLIWLLSDCVSKAWHSNEQGVFQLLKYWSRFHPVSIIQMLPHRLWKGTSLGYAEEARFFATLSMGLNQHLTLKEQDFWFFEHHELERLKKGFKVPVLTLEPDIINSWVKLILGKKDHWLKGIVFEDQTNFIPHLETSQSKKNLEITAEQRIKQFQSFASPTAQKLAAYLACVPLDLKVMNIVQKLMLPESQQTHLAEVFLGGLLQREQNNDWVEYKFHEGVRDLLLDTVILADAVYILTRVSDFVEKYIGKSLDFLALLANPHLTEGIELNKKTQPFAEIGAKIFRRLGGKYESLANRLELVRDKLQKPSIQIDISRLPKPSTNLVGRSEELTNLKNALLDKNKNLAYICAAGGIGKSALTFEWLQKMQPDYLGIEKVFAWSFYSQGSHDTQNSSGAFFEEALPFFGFNGEMPKDDTEKGRLLLKYLNNQSFILILDGLEPLQHRVNILDGEIKDVGIRALIDELFYHGLKAEKSLVLISSRQPLKELEQWDQEKYLNLDLKTLNEKDSIQLLQNLGVKGTEKEFKKTFEEIQGHALSLILLGKLLVNEFDGNIRKRDQLSHLWKEERLGNHTKHILDFYWNLWKKNNPEKALLCLLGLFDRPMGLLEKEHLIKNADIAKPLRKINIIQLDKIEKKLEKVDLLLKNNDDMSRKEWDCYPLIREYVGEQFKKQHFNLFQQAHLKLFEFYQQLPEKDQPDTPEELAPLYRAVVHGCLAGEYKKAREDVYRDRILRKDEYYSLHKLGLYSEDLSALAAFFPQGWLQPVQQGLSEADQAWLLAVASFCLMSLGRLAEAIQPQQADLKMCIKTKDWSQAIRSAQNLVELMLPLGQLTEAVIAAQQALDYAQQTEDLFEQMGSQAYLATALHRVGKLEESQQHFEQAEQLQKEFQPDFPQLYSLRGFQYCALLLDQATEQTEIQTVLKRAEYSLEISERNHWLLDISLDQLTLARAYFKLDELKEAESYFNQSAEGIRKAGKSNHLAYFLIDRANFLIKINKLKEARRDLEEAKQLISLSGMKLYEVDYHLTLCRFFHLTNEKLSFDKHLSFAKTLIKSTKYNLRNKKISELEMLEF